MKKFNKTLVVVLLGLLMLVLGMDAQAYKLVFSNRSVETYGDATASYTLNAIDGISAKTTAVIGQKGAAHIMGTFTVVPDDGTLGELPVKVGISRSVTWNGYNFAAHQIKDGIGGGLISQSSSKVEDKGIMSLKTNHPYTFHLEATANTSTYAGYASIKIVLVPDAVMTPVAISGFITEEVFISQEVAAIKAAAEAVLPPPPPPPPPAVCTVVVAAPAVTPVEPVACPVLPIKEEEDDHESNSNAGTNVNEHANEHSSSDTGENGKASDNAGKKP